VLVRRRLSIGHQEDGSGTLTLLEEGRCRYQAGLGAAGAAIEPVPVDSVLEDEGVVLPLREQRCLLEGHDHYGLTTGLDVRGERAHARDDDVAEGAHAAAGVEAEHGREGRLVYAQTIALTRFHGGLVADGAIRLSRERERSLLTQGIEELQAGAYRGLAGHDQFDGVVALRDNEAVPVFVDVDLDAVRHHAVGLERVRLFESIGSVSHSGGNRLAVFGSRGPFERSGR